MVIIFSIDNFIRRWLDNEQPSLNQIPEFMEVCEMFSQLEQGNQCFLISNYKYTEIFEVTSLMVGNEYLRPADDFLDWDESAKVLYEAQKPYTAKIQNYLRFINHIEPSTPVFESYSGRWEYIFITDDLDEMKMSINLNIRGIYHPLIKEETSCKTLEVCEVINYINLTRKINESSSESWGTMEEEFDSFHLPFIGKELQQTSTYGYTCIFGSVFDALVYKIDCNDLRLVKALKGIGEFLNDRYLLMFYNRSGYGFMDGDAYLFDLVTNETHAFYFEDYQELLTNDYVNGYFVSYNSPVFTTKKYVLIKEASQYLFFYNLDEIIEKKRFLPFYQFDLSPFTSSSMDKIRIDNFDEKTNILTLYDGKQYHIEINFNFKNQLFKTSIKTDLRIQGRYYSGICLDFDSSGKLTIDYDNSNPEGKVNPNYTQLGEIMNQIKAEGEFYKARDLAEMVSKAIQQQFLNNIVGNVVIIPCPPTVERYRQPVYVLAGYIGELLGVPVDYNYLIKLQQHTELKKTQSFEEKRRLLIENLSIPDKRYKDYIVILLDDEYFSGETFEVASERIIVQGQAKKVFALAVIKIKKNRFTNDIKL